MFIRGWIGYFRVADMKRTLMSWDEWMQRRFRMYIWKQWKKPKTKVANLRKLGIPADKAYQWGNSRLGYWRIAGSPVLKCSNNADTVNTNHQLSNTTGSNQRINNIHLFIIGNTA